MNPDGARNQIEGGAVQATSWTLLERVRFDRRRITSTTWESYPILHVLRRRREVDVSSSPSDGNPSRRGRRGRAGPDRRRHRATPLAAALGVRVRDLPLTPEAIVQAIEEETP